MSNSVNPDLTPRFLTFDLGLHSLLRSVCPNILCNYDMETCHILLGQHEESA